jgi:hypothetical protein
MSGPAGALDGAERAGHAAAGEQERPAGARSGLRAVALPSEHGGWGLTAEPVLLGLLVAQSASGWLLGAAAMTAFLARTPLKLALVDLVRHRWLPRSRKAVLVAGCELALLAVLAGVVTARSGHGWWAPLVAALPLVGVEMWFDVRSRGRRLTPELCGALGIASVAVAIARVGGTSWTVAIGLWVVLAARSVGAVPLARAQVARWRSRPVGLTLPRGAQAAAVVVALAGRATGSVPLAPALAIAVAAGWGLWSLQHPPVQPKVLGYSQMAIGLALVLVTAGAWRLG